jgi:ligand-binding sensor domain-containing protein
VGNKWFGTSNGISKFDGTHWTNYTTSDGLGDNYVYSICCDENGEIWAGTYGGYTSNHGLSKFNGTSWTNYGTSSGLSGNCVSNIIADKQNNKWIATNNGVSIFDGTNWTNFTTSNGLVNNDVKSIAIDSLGNKWFGTRFGLSKYDGKNWYSYLTERMITSIAIDKSGNKWISTDLGVYMFDDINWTWYNTSNCAIPGNSTYKIIIDSIGNKWIATYKWLACLSNILDSNESLQFNTICNIYFNQNTNKLTINNPVKSSIILSNLNGQLIKTIETDNYETIVDLVGYKEGVYIVKITSEKGNISRKIIIQN